MITTIVLAASVWESPLNVLFQLAIIFGIVALNGFFVVTEFALVKLRASQLEPLIEEGNRNAERTRHVLANLESYLSATQLGITMANLILGWIGEPYLALMLEPLFSAIGLVGTPLANALRSLPSP